MIGVVVWSNSQREQAVIWCDDHAALAFLGSSADYALNQNWPEPGTILELETETIGAIRHARNVRLVGDAPRTALPELLQRQRSSHLALVHDADAPPEQLRRCVGA